MIRSVGKDYRDFFQNLDEFKKWWNPDWHKNNEKIGIKDPKRATKIFHHCYDPFTSIFPWVTDILKELSKKHLLTILSAASIDSIKTSLDFRMKYFAFIAGAETVRNLKPDAEGINLILKKTKTPRSMALIIGDMPEDILAGKNAEIKTGAVGWGLGKWENLVKLNPDYLFRQPRDLLSI